MQRKDIISNVLEDAQSTEEAVWALVNLLKKEGKKEEKEKVEDLASQAMLNAFTQHVVDEDDMDYECDDITMLFSLGEALDQEEDEEKFLTVSNLQLGLLADIRDVLLGEDVNTSMNRPDRTTEAYEKALEALFVDGEKEDFSSFCRDETCKDLFHNNVPVPARSVLVDRYRERRVLLELLADPKVPPSLEQEHYERTGRCLPYAYGQQLNSAHAHLENDLDNVDVSMKDSEPKVKEILGAFIQKLLNIRKDYENHNARPTKKIKI